VLSKESGSISSKTYNVRIYSQSGKNLNAVLASSSDVTGSNSWSTTTVDFTFTTSYAVSTGTNYAFVIDANSADDTNYAKLHDDSVTAVAGGFATWGSGKVILEDFADTYNPAIKIYRE
jgi:hypothetical protein